MMEIIRKYVPEPDYKNIVDAASNKWARRLPLYEHGVGSKVIYETTGTKPYECWFSSDMSESREGFRLFWDFWKQCGYDTASMEFSLCAILYRHGGGALGAHKEGCIRTREDFEKFPWEQIYTEYFEFYDRYIKNFTETCPRGMKAVGGVGNGVFEAVQDLTGYINLCYIKSDDRELYADLFKKTGELQIKIWKRITEEYGDVFCVHRFGDDLGFKSQTLISVEDIRIHILPAYTKIIELVHRSGKPFLLHSCGCIFGVMDDLINIAKIDAKHSNEDSIAHFTEWVYRYGDQIGNFGGIDTDVLCRFDSEYIREYITDCLEKVRGHGGIAFSSGNSIPDYVPTQSYLTMIETVREWREK